MDHRDRQLCWIILYFFLGVAAVLPVDVRAQTQTGNTALIISGPEADPITLGASFYYTPADGAFTLVPELNPNLDGISIWFQPPGQGVLWDVGFWAPNGQKLQVAEYDNCVGFDGGETVGGVEVAGYGIGCQPPASASFIVHELVRDLDGAIQSFHISFKQSCIESPTASLAGEVFYNSSQQLPARPIPVPTVAPGQLPTFTVSVSPKTIKEGEDAVFTFTAKPAPATRGGVGITERATGGLILTPWTWPVTNEVEFGPGVTTRHVTLHTVSAGETGKDSQWRVTLLRIPIYKLGTPNTAVVTITRPHRHKRSR
jgi:hypothetical protein